MVDFGSSSDTRFASSGVPGGSDEAVSKGWALRYWQWDTFKESQRRGRMAYSSELSDQDAGVVN